MDHKLFGGQAPPGTTGGELIAPPGPVAGLSGVRKEGKGKGVKDLHNFTSLEPQITLIRPRKKRLSSVLISVCSYTDAVLRDPYCRKVTGYK